MPIPMPEPVRHSPDPYRCTGCGQDTIACLLVGDENLPLCSECIGVLKSHPEIKELLLAEEQEPPHPGQRETH